MTHTHAAQVPLKTRLDLSVRVHFFKDTSTLVWARTIVRTVLRLPSALSFSTITPDSTIHIQTAVLNLKLAVVQRSGREVLDSISSEKQGELSF